MVTSCLNILRRTPPSDSEQNLAGLCRLLQSNSSSSSSSSRLVDELLQRVDAPLRVAVDPETDDAYLLCDHNRDGDSHRSPWSNAYYPPLEEGLRPSRRLRALEVRANEVFDVYRRLYYGDDDRSVSSVYAWDVPNDPEALAAIYLVRKELDDNNTYWNSFHVVEAIVTGGRERRSCTYHLTTTVLVSMTTTTSPPESSSSTTNTSNDDDDTTNISGSLTRQVDKTVALDRSDDDDAHLVNIGRMIEDTEHFMRCNMDNLYVQKTGEVVASLRSGTGDGHHPIGHNNNRRGGGGIPKDTDGNRMQGHAMLLNAAIKKRQAENA